MVRPIRLRGLPGPGHLIWLAGLATAAAATVVAATAWFASPSIGELPLRVGTVSSLIAPALRQAVVATEDERFYHHPGLDPIGILRALPYDLSHLTFQQGASTIDQQLAKQLYLGGDDHSPWRKLEDAALAIRLDRRYTKDEILSAYLETAYFGERAYGIAAASHRYFSRSAAQLTLAQASLLAGLIQAPSAYDPFRHPQLARRRQVDVLRAMVRTGSVSERQGTAVLARPLPLARGRALPPLRGVDLAPGPAFAWTELAAGAALAALAALALAYRGKLGRGAAGAPVARVVGAAVVLLGLVLVARSFRVA